MCVLRLNIPERRKNMPELTEQEKQIRLRTVIIRAVTDLLLAVAAVIIFRTDSIKQLAQAGAETRRSAALIIAVSIIADILICAGDLFNIKVYVGHFVINGIITATLFLIIAAISGPLSAFPFIPVMLLPFIYYSVCIRKVSSAVSSDAVEKLNEALVKYNEEAKKDASSKKEKK